MQDLLHMLRAEDLSLDRAALLLARLEYPMLQVEPFLQILDSHAAELRARLGGAAGGVEFVAVVNGYLFQELGFRGNSKNYYDPRNSCLNDVLTARTGIPIALSIIYIEIARRLGVAVEGIGMPGHFVVRYDDGLYSTYIDPFHHGALLAERDCYRVASRAAGIEIPEDPKLLAPSTNRQILLRMIRNLRGVYLARQAFGKALSALDLLLSAEPSSAIDYKTRSWVHLQLKNPAAAKTDLESYLALAPEGSDRAEVEKNVRSLSRYLARLN